MDVEKEHQAALVSLDEHHLDPLRDAVQHILFTQRAEYIFAQVAEGLPTRDTSIFKHDIDPEIAERVEPGQEAIDLVRSWWADFHLEHLEISSSTLRAYNDTRLGTREFKLRLIEAIAIVIHTLAALLFEHTNQAPYKRPLQQQKFIFVNGKPELCDEWIDSPFPTYLYHNDYLDYDIYPMGIADVVAYWEETHLFGGVVVFYHGSSNTEFLDVLLHPDSDFKVFKLSDAQIDGLVNFGLYGEPQVSSPLPIKAERDALRLLPQFTIQQHIYRSKNDRRVPEIPRGWHPRHRMDDDPQLLDVVEKYRNGEFDTHIQRD